MYVERVEERRPKGGVLKTLISIVLVIPGALLGAPLKGVAVWKSPQLKEGYRHIDRDRNEYEKEKSGIVIALFRKDAAKVFFLLEDLNKRGKLERFIAYCHEYGLGGDLAFLEDYQNLFMGDYDQRVIDPKVEYVIGCFFKFIVDKKVRVEEFFDKLKQLDGYAQALNPETMEELPSIQKQFDIREDFATVLPKVEAFLVEKGFFSG